MKRCVVLDTNCLVQMLSVHSPYRPAWQAFRDGRYILCVSNEILEEYQKIIARVANEAVAHNVVSEDAHFRVLEQIPFPKVCVIRLQQFVKEMTEP